MARQKAGILAPRVGGNCDEGNKNSPRKGREYAPQKSKIKIVIGPTFPCPRQ